jgi:hypothetical protein
MAASSQNILVGRNRRSSQCPVSRPALARTTTASAATTTSGLAGLYATASPGQARSMAMTPRVIPQAGSMIPNQRCSGLCRSTGGGPTIASKPVAVRPPTASQARSGRRSSLVQPISRIPSRRSMPGRHVVAAFIASPPPASPASWHAVYDRDRPARHPAWAPSWSRGEGSGSIRSFHGLRPVVYPDAHTSGIAKTGHHGWNADR